MNEFQMENRFFFSFSWWHRFHENGCTGQPAVVAQVYWKKPINTVYFRSMISNVALDHISYLEHTKSAHINLDSLCFILFLIASDLFRPHINFQELNSIHSFIHELSLLLA